VSWRERLRTAVRASRRKHSAIAADAGITPVTLSHILNAAEVKPAFETVVRIAHAVGENVGWLLAEPDYPLSAAQRKELAEAVEFLQTTFLGRAIAREDARNEPNAVALRRPFNIPRREQMLGARLVFRATGPSMADAGIAEGDLVFVKPVRDIREADRSLVVCRLGASEYVKQLEQRDGYVRLLSRNDRYTPIDVGTGDDFALIGVVVGQERRHR